jgi:hypothetical protein
MQLVVVVVVFLTLQAVAFIFLAGQVAQAVAVVVAQPVATQVVHELELVFQISVARLG